MLFVIKHKWYFRYHAVVLITTIVSQIVFLSCPLTVLENAIRAQYDPEAKFDEPFIGYYLERYFGIQISPESITLMLVAIVGISAVIFLRKPKEREIT